LIPLAGLVPDNGASGATWLNRSCVRCVSSWWTR